MYNPSIHTATNKPIGIVGKPVDARTYFYDAVNFTYRPYVNTAEVLAYLTTSTSRIGHFSAIVNTGGSLSAGVITGGTNVEWWFKDGVADGNLIVKVNGGAPVRPDPIPITANVSVTPLSISYTGDVNTTDYILRRLSDGWNNKTVMVTFDGSTFIISGDDGGSGFWAEDYVFQILP